jgi:hypothetical protein
MKKINTAYYLLFVLLIMGAFASMAQNDYGNTILGIVAFSFSLLFTIQLVTAYTTKEQSEKINTTELLSLIALAVILGLRVFYIHFKWVEYIYVLAGAVLLMIYLKRLISTWNFYSVRNKTVAYLLSFVFSSIILYITAMTFVPFSPQLTEPMGEVAFAVFIPFAAGVYFKKNLMVDGEKTSAISLISQRKDSSLVLLVLFLLFTAYMGLTKLNAIPKMYSNELPQVYFDLVKKTESAEEKASIKKTSPEEFKKAYDRFVEKNVE